MTESIRLLLVEDSSDDESLLLRALTKGGLEVQHERVQTEPALRDCLSRGPWDMVISDYSMPTFNGIAAYNVLRDSGLDIPFIFVSGNLGEETAVEAMRLGVSDYFLKSNLKRLVPAVQRELRKMEDRRARRVAEMALQTAQQQLQQAQKMEALGQLAGGVAHDFNNLLTVILGYLDLIKDANGNGEVLAEGLNEIKTCAERAAALTHQLLAVGRRQYLKPKPTDLNEVVRNVAKMLDRVIGENVSLHYDLDAKLPLVMADAGQIEQVILNLVINGRDAMPQGGEMKIETRALELSQGHLSGAPGVEPGPFALLAVHDHGQGMSPEMLERIFEPFYTTKAEGKGTGLGLSMVYGIVKQGKGHLMVESELGKGSCFRVFLPIAASGAKVGVKEQAPVRAKRGGGTVLLVEDEDSLRSMVQKVLISCGYRVLHAAGPEQAMTVALSYPGQIDLLLTDLTMPVMDGKELARRMSDLRPGIKILYMTGYAAPNLIEGLDEAHWLFKPFLPHQMVEKVASVLAYRDEG